MKRILAFMLCAVLLCTFLPHITMLASAEGYSGYVNDYGDYHTGNLRWSLNRDTHTMRIYGTDEMIGFNGHPNPPWYGKRDQIWYIVIEEGVPNIGFRAFEGCSNLRSVSIPDSVIKIGYNAFADCTKLEEVTIPNSVPYIVSGLFYNCSSLSNFSIGNNVTRIERDAFAKCTALTSIDIPGSVTLIEEHAFYNSGYYNNSNNWKNGALYLDNWLIDVDNIATESFEIERGTIGIAAFACVGMSNVKNLVIPNSVKYVCDGAFYDCPGISGVYISDLAAWCELKYQHYAGVFNIEDTNPLCHAQKLYLNNNLITELTIPDNTTKISDYAFYNCRTLTSVKTGNGVTSIGDYAFYSCFNIKQVTIGENVKSIGESAFQENGTLSIINLGNSVERIKKNAFADCAMGNAEPIEISVPKSVNYIGEGAFSTIMKIRILTIYNPYCTIDGGSTTLGWSDFTLLRSSSGSTTETYARTYGYAFEAINLSGFVDVHENDYYFNPVMWAVNHDPQITAGVDATHFGPNNDCTREQIVTFLWAANGKPEPATTGEAFSDVPKDAWYYKPVMWAVQHEITSGVSGGVFGVGQPCTRAQAMTFLWAAKGKPEPESTVSPFNDVSSGDWFCKPILWAAENGVTAGIGDGLFGVNNTCTRAQIITFLYKVYGAG